MLNEQGHSDMRRILGPNSREALQFNRWVLPLTSNTHKSIYK